VTSGTLERRLGLGDAVVVGIGSMIGAGVFVAWSPAAWAAGTGSLVGLAIAAVVAFCNATSSAQLAAVHPESGGTYVYARRQLGSAWGHLAGWGFTVGKTASCAAVALTVGAYLWPGHERLAAVAAVIVVTATNIGGLSRTVTVTRIILVIAILALACVVVAGWSAPDTSFARITPITGNVLDQLRAAGFLFFAFAGYARIATLGEEVREPERTIPRAIPLALGLVLLLYAIVGVTALAAVPSAQLATTDAPLVLVVEAGGTDVVAPIVRIGAGFAALGVLLTLIPGVSRTALAMARRRELPAWLAHIDPGRATPVRAELTIALILVALTVTIDLRDAVGFSAVAVLTYYAITNLSALTLPPDQRRWPRLLAITGVVGCLTLVATLPAAAIVAGALVLAIGMVVHRATGATPEGP
jgi:APA family basic amino acid/polyamine antiporter